MEYLDFPVDAVYMWVDGNDPHWAGKKQNALRRIQAAGEANLDDSSFSENRFRDNDELKYSLRSLEKCMPWVRKVFLITDNQHPAWVNRREVVIIDHRDIFPDGDHLPTFNSHSIELCQHRIDGLSECFISFNDDFMLGKVVRKQDFFTKHGNPVIWSAKLGRKHRPKLIATNYDQMTPHRAGETRARRIILDRYAQYLPYRIRHYPKPMTRSIMEEIWEKFPDEVNRTLSSQFRCSDDMAIHAFFSFYSIASGKGTLRIINGARQITDALWGKLRYMGATIGDANFKRKIKYISIFKPFTFCLNDGNKAAEVHLKVVNDFFKKLYPHASKYEKPVPVQGVLPESE